MTNEPTRTDGFHDGMPFLGGALWLDLANSSFMLDGNAYDFFADDAGFRGWATVAGFELEPERITAERLAALALRGIARSVLADIMNGRTPGAEQVESINQLLKQMSTSEYIVPAANGISVETREAIAGPHIAVTIAKELAHFLSKYEPERLKSCHNPACSMVFYDRGKNNRRRWCTMSICGNRDKVANYRARKNKQLSTASEV